LSFIIRTIDLTADHREIVREREVAGDTLSIGRASDNALPLPDLAVEQRHATVSAAPGGQLRIVANGRLGFSVEGKASTAATLDPADGSELGFGNYRLSISRDGDGPVVVTVRKKEEIEGAHDSADGFALSSVMIGKRPLAWGLLAVILAAFLAVPIWSNLHSQPVSEPAMGASDKVMWDKSWESGKLSLAHHGLENNCKACHVQPFVAVRDDACVACHKMTGDHAAHPRLDRARGEPEGFNALLRKVAHTFNKPGAGACTDCHTEHEGAGHMEPTSQQFCADCHDGLKTRLPDTQLGDAGDFGTEHPQFKALLITEPGQTKPTRISLAAKPRQWEGLAFPHALHLSATGGVARMAGNLSKAKGYGGKLDCADCHHPNKDRSGFVPVEMERDCEACHSLVYDKVGSTYRTLRHGDVAQMRADLTALDRVRRTPISSGRRRPGSYAEGGLYHQNFGAPVRNYIGINRALSRDGVCGECHTPTVRGGQPDVMPVNLPMKFFTDGAFDHEAHEQTKCAECHKANASKSSADLLIPGIATCRTCHAGENTTRAEVPSSCAMCHAYHPRGRKPANHPAAPDDRIALAGRRGT
jgi:hypothetical protein